MFKRFLFARLDYYCIGWPAEATKGFDKAFFDEYVLIVCSFVENNYQKTTIANVDLTEKEFEEENSGASVKYDDLAIYLDVEDGETLLPTVTHWMFLIQIRKTVVEHDFPYSKSLVLRIDGREEI